MGMPTKRMIWKGVRSQKPLFVCRGKEAERERKKKKKKRLSFSVSIFVRFFLGRKKPEVEKGKKKEGGE